MRVILCGAAGALGTATLDRFTSAGDRVACIDRAAPAASGAGSAWLQCADLADPDLARQMVEQAVAWLGGLDAVVQLVGTFEWEKIPGGSVTTWRALYRANVETTLAIVQSSIGHMTDGGSIVVVGAASAEPAGAGMAPYAAAKSGVARLGEALSQELLPQGIRVNAILPRVIDTPRNRHDMPAVDPRTWTSPAAVGEVIHFLASPASRAINGASIPVTNAA